MKFKVNDKQLDQLYQIKNHMLMNTMGGLLSITDFTVDKIEKERGIWTKRKETISYITSITIKGYNPSGHFLGTFNESDSFDILGYYTNPLLNINFYTPRNKFIELTEALNAFGFELKKIDNGSK